MTLRNIALLTGLAGILGGCVVAPDPHYYPDQGAYYDDGYYYDYHTTPSYEGYYYARIIFLGDIPYYVDDDRRIQPIPPRLYAHFRNYSYRTGPSRVPVFSPDREVRDGYPMSRIIYFNDTPYYVGDDRAARPVPNNLRERFRYIPYQNNAPMYGNRPQPPMIRQNEPRNGPPAYGRDWDRSDPPAYGRDTGRNEPPVYMQGRDRMDPPAYSRGDDDGGYSGQGGPQRILPRQALPPQQPDPRFNGDPHFGGPAGGGRMMPPDRGDQRQVAPQQQPFQPPVQQNSGDDPHFGGSAGGGRMMPPDRGDQRQVAPQQQPFQPPVQRGGDDSRGGPPFGAGRARPEDRPQPNGGGNNRPVPDRRKPRGDEGNGGGNGRFR